MLRNHHLFFDEHWLNLSLFATVQVDPVYAAIFVASMFFPALATIFKERIFASAKQRLNGQSLDIFVVNSFGSAAQALFVFLMLPVMSSLRGIPLSGLPAYIKQGMAVDCPSLECTAAACMHVTSYMWDWV